MRRLLVVAAVAVAVAHPGSRANAQQLDLGLGVTPPELGEKTYVAALIAQLEDEIEDLGRRERSAGEAARDFIRAAINCRILAAELLTNGLRGGDASPAIVAGLGLAQGRDAIDDALRSLVEPAKRLAEGSGDPTTADSIRSASHSARLFNDKSIDLAESIRTARGRALDRSLTLIFAPLADAVSIAVDDRVADHWPIESPAAAGGASVPAGAARTRSVAELTQRLAAATLRDQTRREIETILAFLRRGQAFSEYQPLVRDYREVIGATIDLGDALQACQWIGPEQRAAYEDRLHAAIVLFKDPRTREQGRADLERLEALRRVMLGITDLSDRRVDVRPLRDALDAIQADDDRARGARRLATLQRVIESMAAFREVDRSGSGLTRDIRRANQRLVKAYVDAEEALLDEIAMLSRSGADALADPSFASLVADLRQYVRDLQRVREVQGWIDSLRAIDPAAADPFAAQVRKMCSWLLDPTRRPDAIRAMQQFERQRSLFVPLPFESELRGGTAVAIMATGSLQQQLVDRIEAERARWAGGWAEGNASSEAAAGMLQLYRLTRAMEDAAAVIRLGGDADVLNRWAAWEMPTGTFERPLSDLPTRLKLATADAVSANTAMLARHLDEIDEDAPLARLAGRLTEMLEEDLVTLPDGALSTLGQLVHPPTARSRLLDRRRELADLCHHAVEQEYARSRGDDDLNEQLQVYVGARAQELLAELGEQPRELATLAGFDGSDPDADG